MILSIRKNIWFATLIGIAILVIGLFLMNHVNPTHRDAIASGFLADMVITFPATFYFLVIKPLGLRKWNILLVITCCCTMAYFILPVHQRRYIMQLRELIALPEIAVLVYTLSKIRLIRREYRQMQTALPDVANNLYKSMAVVMGEGIGIKIIASEVTVLRFALIFWKRQTHPENAQCFTIHREIGYAALFSVILFACGIELVAFHLFLLHYSHVAAFIITGFSVYGTLFLVGDLSAILKSPVMILENQILLRTGLRWRALINKDNVIDIQKVSDTFLPDEACFNGAIMKNRANVLFSFTIPVTIERLYRKPIMSKQILMTIDEAELLISTLKTM